MPVKQDLVHTWQCNCGKWNFADAKVCWSCHEPKVGVKSTSKTKVSKAKANA